MTGEEVQSWSRMQAMSVALLERRTGAGLDEWNRRVRVSGADSDEKTLRAWLAAQGVSGYPQQLLVFERFGYPDYLTASSDELVAAQYEDRPALRAILDRLIESVQEVGDVTIQARKGYVTFVGPRRTFALVRAATRGRVDLGLRLEKGAARGRLVAAGSMPQGWATLKVELRRPEEVDAEVRGFLELAYSENS